MQQRRRFPLEQRRIVAAVPCRRLAAGDAPVFTETAELPHHVQLDGKGFGFMRHRLHFLCIHPVAVRQIPELAQQCGGQILRVVTLNQHAANP